MTKKDRKRFREMDKKQGLKIGSTESFLNAVAKYGKILTQIKRRKV